MGSADPVVIGQGAVGRARNRDLDLVAPLEKGLCRATTQASRRAHAFIVSGKLQVRNGVLNAGDCVYEPSGILHDATTALEDTTYLFICNGAVLFFDENGFTRYTNWEVMEKLRAQAAPEIRAEAAE